MRYGADRQRGGELPSHWFVVVDLPELLEEVESRRYHLHPQARWSACVGREERVSVSERRSTYVVSRSQVAMKHYSKAMVDTGEDYVGS